MATLWTKDLRNHLDQAAGMPQETTPSNLPPRIPGVRTGFNPDKETIYDLSTSPDGDTERNSILVLAVEDAFASNGNVIVYETDIASESFHSNDDSARRIKPVGSGFPAALGFIEARNRLQQTHSVVLVAHAATVDSTLRHLDRLAIDDLDRCVIVAPIPARGIHSPRDKRLQRFEARGGRVVDLTNTRNLLQLAAAFRQLRDLQTVHLVLIDVDVAPAWQRRPDSWPNGDRRGPVLKQHVARRVLMSSVVTEIAQFTRDDRRSIPVLFDSRRPWQEFVEEFGTRTLVMADHDVGESIAWCGAVARGGCHPVIVLNLGQLTEHADTLRSNVFSLQHRATVIVVDSVTRSVNETASALAPILTDVPVVIPGTPDEVAPLTRVTLQSESPLLLYLPVESGLYSPERDRWLDFRAAARLRDAAAKGSHSPPMLGLPRREYRRTLNGDATPDARKWMNEYSRVGCRDPQFWRWITHAIEMLELSSVDPMWRRRNRDTKFLAAMFNALLEDSARGCAAGEPIQHLNRLVREGRTAIRESGSRAGISDLAGAVWDEIWTRAAAYPRYHEFADLLQHDFRQSGNTIDYANLVLRQPEMINSVEQSMYSPQGTIFTCAATMDLMCSPRFDANELGPLREVLWHAACMVRYGNLLTTWRRDVRRRDVTSGVFIRAIESGWLNRRELQQMTLDQVEKCISFVSIEREFLNRWQIHRACILQLRERVPSCSVRSYVEGLDRLLVCQYASRDALLNPQSAAQESVKQLN